MSRLEELARQREAVSRLVAGSVSADAAYVAAADLLEGIELGDLPELRVAILRSFTIEPLIDVLRVKAFLEGWRLAVFLGEFNQYQQEILDAASPLYAFRPRMTIVALRLEDLCPEISPEARPLGEIEAKEAVAQVTARLEGLLDTLVKRSEAEVLLSNFLVPASGPFAVADSRDAWSGANIARALNLELVRLAQARSRIHVMDLDSLASREGKTRFCDRLQWYRAANPFRLSAYPEYGEMVITHVRALCGRRRKCLVLDLDGTLWGGVVGEDGPTGIQLSDTYPGNCFKDFQRAVLALHRRGVVLALNSKNNHEDALEVIRTHPDMVLREEHFSAVRINWRDKAENLRDIAAELGLGLDALVFVDDSGAECERVRQACPEVLVVPLPPERHAYRGVLEGLTCFDQLATTAEDRARGELYRARARGAELARESASLEDFYASLEMRAIVYRNEASQVSRLAQMTQKTNQFNLTTRRCSEGEIRQLMEDGRVYSLRLEDRFGDHGVVGAAIVVPRTRDEWAITNLLLSCRVVMRTVEDTLLAEIAADAARAGVTTLVGEYVPTAKNGMVEDFYARRGFAVRATMPSGAVVYELALGGNGVAAPSPWIRVRKEGRCGP